MSTWYRNGTVTVTNGSPIVVGVSTTFTVSGLIKAGDIFMVLSNRGEIYEIAEVIDNDTLRLDSPYEGATQVSAPYRIILNFTATNDAGLVAQYAQMLIEKQAYDVKFTQWVSGSASGGPNLDGRYPIPTTTGDVLVPCPALMISTNVQTAQGVHPGMAKQTITTPGYYAGCDLSDYDCFHVILNFETCDLGLQNPSTDSSKVSHKRFIIEQGTGGNKYVFPANVRWSTGYKPQQSQLVGRKDIIDLISYDGGGTWLAFFSGYQLP